MPVAHPMRPPLVLAYHGLGSYPRYLDPHNLMVDPERFREQMLTLMRRGYSFVSLTDLVANLDDGALPDGLCVLTFDDGTLDNLELLLPVLAELGLPATIFVCPGLLGQNHFAMPPSARVRLMNVEELLELASSPLVDIGSHT